jgi:hypothetical protein
MTPDPTRDDLSFLRRISEEGRHAPLLGGRYLLFWGTAITIAYLGQYGILSGRLGLPEFAIPLLWLAVFAVAGIAMHLFGRQMRYKPGTGAVGNRAERWVWYGVGLGIFAFASGVFLAVGFAGQAVIAFDFIAGVALAGYGAAFLVVAKLAAQRWLEWPAVGAFAGAALVPFLAGDPRLYLVAAVIVFLVAAVPGLILLRAEPAPLPRDA